jgi:C-terminal binding-module, SLH-like, of glucodextranase
MPIYCLPMRFLFNHGLVFRNLALVLFTLCCSSAIAAESVLFSVADPQGDALGDGLYALPSNLPDKTVLDLRTFTVLDDAGKLDLKLSFASVQNTEQAPNGFSYAVIDIFMNTERGGLEELGDTGFHTPPGRGWRYHVRVNGWTALLETAKNAPAGTRVSSKITVQTDGANIVLKTQLPADAYRYWAFVSLYDPLSKNGVRQVSQQASPFDISSNLKDAPSALDVLSESSQVGFYSSLEVPSLNEPKLELNPLLYSLFAGLALSLVATIWGFFRRP